MKEKNTNIEELFQKLGLIKASELLKKKHEDISNLESAPISNPSTNVSLENIESAQVIKSIREKLASLPKNSTKTEGSKISAKPNIYSTIGKVEGRLYEFGNCSCLRFSNSYPKSYKYGDVFINDALKFSAKQANISSPGLEIPEFDVYKAIFIDTETTSCYGGTGTVAFLIGVGYFDMSENFCIEQFFMRDFDEEIPLLHGVGKLIEKSSILIGYNSKSFDLPLLRNRYLINHIPFPKDEILHFDLMHVARRFWNRRLVDCSLVTVEKSILGVRRFGDIPGSLIPKIWRDYISTGRENLIPKILQHNERDILSLVGLMAWLAERILVPQGKGFDEVSDKLALMRLQIRSKNYEEAKDTAEHLLEICESPLTRCECWKQISEVLKKLGLINERISALEQWAKEDTNSVLPCIELAKIYEHQVKDIKTALFWTERALNIEPGNISILKRRERLLSKLAKIDSSLFDSDYHFD